MNPLELQQLIQMLQAQGQPEMGPPAPMMSNGMPMGTQFSAGQPNEGKPLERPALSEDPLRMAQLAMGAVAAGGTGIGMGARAGIANAGRQGAGEMFRQLKDPAEAMFGPGRMPFMPNKGPSMGQLTGQMGGIDPRILMGAGMVGAPAAYMAPDLLRIIEALKNRGQ